MDRQGDGRVISQIDIEIRIKKGMIDPIRNVFAYVIGRFTFLRIYQAEEETAAQCNAIES